MASASISTSISGDTMPPTCTIAVAGRILPKNSPCARPFFPLGDVGDEHARAHHVFQARSGLVQRGFDVAQRLHRLSVGVAHAHEVPIRAGSRRAGNVDRIAHSHRA